jgi:hypothetical protein
MAGLDSLFKVPGVRAIQEHLFVMIEFQNQGATLFHFFLNQSGDYAKIGGDPGRPFAPLDDEPHWVHCVVGHGEWINEQIAENERVPGLELDDIDLIEQRGYLPRSRITRHHRNF